MMMIPGRESLILTAAGQGIVYVAPPGPGTVSGPAVTLREREREKTIRIHYAEELMACPFHLY